MNYKTTLRKPYRACLSTVLLMTGLLFTGIKGAAQNINTPNATGPMGIEVNSYTGNLFFERTDFVIPGVEMGIVISFSYNSYNYDINRGFGNGWSFKYNVQYMKDSAENMVIFWGDGREDIYQPLGNGNYQSPIGFFTSLKEYEPGKFSITESSGKKYLFEDNVKKRLTKIEGTNNNFIAIHHTDTLITSLENNFGQSITLTYDINGQLKSVTDAIMAPSRTWNYTYDVKGNLTEATDPLGAKNTYTYMINGPVKTVSDKNLNVVDLVYYNDYSLHEMIGCNKRMSFSYDTTQKLTIITDHLDNGQNLVNKYYYKTVGKISWLSAISGNCCGFDVTIEYDSQGNKIKETDANGNVTNYTYDSRGNMLTSTNALGQTTAFTYTSDLNLMSSIKDPKGFSTTLEYDARGNLTKLTKPDGSIYTATYDAIGNVVTITDPGGNVTSYTYDASGKLKTVSGPEGLGLTANLTPRGELLSYTDPNNKTHSFQYDILSRMTQLTDPLNNKMNFSYDAAGNLFLIKNKNNEQGRMDYDASNRVHKVTEPLGSTTVFGYDGLDNVVSISDALGAVTAFEYNNKNLLSVIRDAEGNENSYLYDRNGNLITENHPSGQTITYSYDALDRLTEISDNTGTIGKIEYDGNGNITRYTDASGAMNQYEYDNLDRIKKYTDALGNSSELSYDEAGNVQTIRDRNGKTSTLIYDHLNRIISISDNNGAVTQIGYDSNSNVTSLTDANNNTTTYTYDELNRVTRTTFPDGKYTESTYDVKNNVIAFREKSGNTITLVYDSLNRIVTKTLPDGQVFNYGYDNTGKVISATNDAGTVYFTYDFLNRITSETFNGRTVTYTYDVNNRTQKTIYPDNTEITKTFDTRNRLVSIQKNNEPVVTYQYNNAGQVISKSFGNGLTTNLQYDFAGRLTNLTTGSFQNLSYTYDKNGNRASIIRGNNLSEFFTYDDGNRLLAYKRGASGGPFSINDSYSYDALGNRVSASIGGKNIAYTTNSLNQMLSFNDGTQTTNFVYDNNGNLIYDGKYHKSYDANKKLLKDSASPAEVIIYQYDAIGRMIGKTVNGITSYYTYSGLSAIEERDINDIIKNRTIFNGFLEPVVNEHFEIPFYYHQNHLLSVDALTNSTGNLAEQYRYDVYGKQSVFDASGNPLSGSITGNRFGYTGQVYDSSTGQNNFYFRNYNPETGLFNQQDLIGYGDGMGMYQYVGNNPANGIDVLGLECGTESTETKYSRWSDPTIKKDKEWVIKEAIKDAPEFIENLNIPVIPHDDLVRNTYKTFSKSENFTDFLMHGGDAIKNGTQVGLGTATTKSLMSGNLEGAGLAVAANLTIAGVDATSQAVFNMGEDPVGSAENIKEGLTKVAKLRWKILEKRYKEHEKYLEEIRKKYGDDQREWSREARDVFRIHEEDKEKLSKRKIRNSKSCPQNNKPNGTRRDPPGGKTPGKTATTEVIRSFDPNEIIGPDGQPDKRWVSVKDRLPYTVTFENSEIASAPAKYVKVIVPAHEKMDAGTFELSNFGFNNQSFSVPVSTASSYQRLDARDSLDLFIDLVAGYDVVKHEFFWEFQSIDPVTLMQPTDPLKGFLLLQDTTGDKTKNGHGFVNFSIKPVSNAQTLDSILAFAKIVFDQNDTIPTNIEHNIIDAVAPSSQMNMLEASYNNVIPLSWSGQDDPNGCGVHYYTLYYSTDGTNFSILKDRITRTDTLFAGMPNTVYSFFVLATDSVGNTEQLGTGAVVSTYLGSVLSVTWLYFKGTNKNKDNLLEWATANERNTKEFRIERSFDAQTFSVIGTVSASGNTTGNSSYQYTDYDIDRLGQNVMYYRLAQVDLDGRSSLSNVVRLNYIADQLPKTIVYPNPTKGWITVVVGDKKLIGSIATVYDEAGKLLQSVKITSQQQQFNFGGYTNGLYIIRLANKKVLKVMKH